MKRWRWWFGNKYSTSIPLVLKAQKRRTLSGILCFGDIPNFVRKSWHKIYKKIYSQEGAEWGKWIKNHFSPPEEYISHTQQIKVNLASTHFNTPPITNSKQEGTDSHSALSSTCPIRNCSHHLETSNGSKRVSQYSHSENS